MPQLSKRRIAAKRAALKGRSVLNRRLRRKELLKNPVARKCSVCLKKYVESGDTMEEEVDDIVSASQSLSGNRGPETLLPKYKESSVMFLVTSLLGIPSEECVKYRVKYGDPSDWFTICDTCYLDMKTAKEMHNQILQLQDNLGKIKEKLTALMKTKSENEDEMEDVLVYDGGDGEQLPTWNWHDVAYDIRQYFLGHQVENQDEEENNDNQIPGISKPSNSVSYDQTFDVQMSDDENSFVKEESQFKSEDLESELIISDVELEADADLEVGPDERDVEVGLVPSTSQSGAENTPENESDKQTLDDIIKEEIQSENGVLPFIMIARNMSESMGKPTHGTGSALESELNSNPPDLYGNRNLFNVKQQNDSNPNPPDGTGTCKPEGNSSSNRPDLTLSNLSVGPQQNECTRARCFQKFPSKEDLKSHIQDAHKDCLYCKSCFHVVATAKTLENHIRKEHFAYIISQCRECSVIMPLTDDFNRHLEGNSTCKAKAVSCELCSEFFASENSLALHVQVRHVEENLLRYECSTCKKRFKGKDSLQSHQIKEHSAPKFSCEKCEKSFSNKRSLASHLKNIHLSKEPGGKKYKCKVCKRAFNSSNHCSRHEKLHGDESPFSCSVCDKKYKVRSQLTTHMWSHDPDRYEKYSLYKYGKGKLKTKTAVTQDDGDGEDKQKEGQEGD